MQKTYKVAYIYAPSLSEEDIRNFVAAVSEAGLSIDRLGKSDPPRKWTGRRQNWLKQSFEEQI